MTRGGARAGAGAPRRPEGRRKPVSTAMDDRERKQAEAYARQVGLKLSVYLRVCSLVPPDLAVFAEGFQSPPSPERALAPTTIRLPPVGEADDGSRLYLWTPEPPDHGLLVVDPIDGPVQRYRMRGSIPAVLPNRPRLLTFTECKRLPDIDDDAPMTLRVPKGGA